MGAYSPPEFWDADLERKVRDAIMEPVARALAKEGCPYRGVLYGGLILTEDGPKVIEFNCRLGDPEAQVIIPRMSSDLAEILVAVLDGKLSETTIRWSSDACVGVAVASGGYPASYETGFVISGLSQAQETAEVFHAGTRPAEDGEGAVTSGGRVLTVVGKWSSLEEARARAYRSVESISFAGGFHRRDIAAGTGVE